jgi:hypothetical protein
MLNSILKKLQFSFLYAGPIYFTKLKIIMLKGIIGQGKLKKGSS